MTYKKQLMIAIGVFEDAGDTENDNYLSLCLELNRILEKEHRQFMSLSDREVFEISMKRLGVKLDASFSRDYTPDDRGFRV